MAMQDAIDRLDMVGHDFFVYLDQDSGYVQVVYKRRDEDGHGLIIPIPDADTDGEVPRV
jgi:putative sigma-54 modulation protein